MKIQMWIAIGLILIGAALVQGCEKKEVRSGADATVKTEPVATATHEAGSLQPAEQAKPAAGDLAIVDWGPKGTKAGVPFSVQPDGSCAIYFTVKKASPDLAIFFNDTELPGTAVDPAGNTVTATVPPAMFEKAGDIQAYVKDKKTGDKSQSVVFKVQ